LEKITIDQIEFTLEGWPKEDFEDMRDGLEENETWDTLEAYWI
jgi:hypothetical protein